MGNTIIEEATADSLFKEIRDLDEKVERKRRTGRLTTKYYVYTLPDECVKLHNKLIKLPIEEKRTLLGKIDELIPSEEGKHGTEIINTCREAVSLEIHCYEYNKREKVVASRYVLNGACKVLKSLG